MLRCEICEAPATRCCAGLDVPMLHFCTDHGLEHVRICPDVRDGRASVVSCDALEKGEKHAK